MPRNVVVDAGPLVAWLHAADARHEWAREAIGRLPPPLISCEAALSDAAYVVADACVVRLTELLDDSMVMTFDADFRIYRRHRRLVIPLLAPDGV